MRLIDADKLYPDCLDKTGRLAISQSQIANAPTVSFMISPDYVTELQNHNKELIKQLEEVEKPQGKWLFNPDSIVDDMVATHFCSICGRGGYSSHDSYCWYCGAKMMKGGKE